MFKFSRRILFCSHAYIKLSSSTHDNNANSINNNYWRNNLDENILAQLHRHMLQRITLVATLLFCIVKSMKWKTYNVVILHNKCLCLTFSKSVLNKRLLCVGSAYICTLICNSHIHSCIYTCT